MKRWLPLNVFSLGGFLVPENMRFNKEVVSNKKIIYTIIVENNRMVITRRNERGEMNAQF